MSEGVIRRVVLHLPPMSAGEAHAVAREAGERIAHGIGADRIDHGALAAPVALQAIPHEPSSMLSRRIAASVTASRRGWLS
jgi:hypothetical protein